MPKKINSRQKGAAGEREVVHILRKYGYKDARRGQQYCGANGDADVVGFKGYHLEVKRDEHVNIEKAMQQAVRDAKEGETPAAVHRKNGEKWKITMYFEDYLRKGIGACPDENNSK